MATGTITQPVVCELPIFYYSADSTKTLYDNYVDARSTYGTGAMIIYILTGFIGSSSVLGASLPTQACTIRIVQHNNATQRATVEAQGINTTTLYHAYIYNGSISSWYTDTVTGQYTVTTETVTSGASLAASTYKLYSITATKSGYYPVGIMGIAMSGSGSTSVVLARYYLESQTSGSCKVYAGIRNISSSAITPTVNAQVLWVKE